MIEQRFERVLAYLLYKGVRPEDVYAAVSSALDMHLGECVSLDIGPDGEFRRTFVQEQARRLSVS